MSVPFCCRASSAILQVDGDGGSGRWEGGESTPVVVRRKLVEAAIVGGEKVHVTYIEYQMWYSPRNTYT